jgi:hypothetical protein
MLSLPSASTVSMVIEQLYMDYRTVPLNISLLKEFEVLKHNELCMKF